MLLAGVSHDSLPYIDKEPTAAERRAAQTLIISALPQDRKTALHPSIPPLAPFQSSTLLAAEYPRIARQEPWTGGISTTRYESLDTLSENATSEELKKALRSSYTSSSYLRERNINLGLLEEYGKDGWLRGNEELESILRGVEMRLAEVREQTEEVNRERKGLQEASREEIEGLEREWREGIDRSIRVKVEVMKLKREVAGEG